MFICLVVLLMVTVDLSLEQYKRRYGEIMETDEHASPDIPSHDNSKKTRRSTSSYLKVQRQCFIYNESRASDGNSYNNSGLSRCCEGSAAKNLEDTMNCYLELPNHRMFSVANHLHMISSGQAHDIYAAIYYYQSCYIKFALKPITSEKSSQPENISISKNLMDEFLLKLNRNILQLKSAYLLSDLLKDLIGMFEEQAIVPPFTSVKELKRRLIDRFNDNIGFFTSRRQVIAYSPDMNHCKYSVSTLEGFGLRDDDLLKAFGNMITVNSQRTPTSRKLSSKTTGRKLCSSTRDARIVQSFRR